MCDYANRVHVIFNNLSFRILAFFDGCESLVSSMQRDDLQKVMDLLSVKDHHARTLLIHYRWDVDKVFTVFVEMGKEWLFKEAGVTVEEHNDLSPVRSSSGDVRCDICMDDIPANRTTTMDCGHCFCNECEHFTTFFFSLPQSWILLLYLIAKFLPVDTSNYYRCIMKTKMYAYSVDIGWTTKSNL